MFKGKNISIASLIFYYSIFFLEKPIKWGERLTIIPYLSTEWIVSFTLQLQNMATSQAMCNVIHFTTGGDGNGHGARTPSLFLNGNRNQFLFTNSVNGNHNYNTYTPKGLSLDGTPTHIEIHQRYLSAGKMIRFPDYNMDR